MTQGELEFLAMVGLGVFSVDQDGRVWKQAEISTGSRGARLEIRETKPRLIDEAERGGYRRIHFRSWSGKFSISPHRIVWMIANRREIPEALQINHKDGNRKNNHPENLETVTAKENMQHAAKILKSLGKGAARGESHYKARLTLEQVVEVKLILKSGSMSHRQIGEKFGVVPSCISSISKGRTWRDVQVD